MTPNTHKSEQVDGLFLVAVCGRLATAVAFWCQVVRTSLANPRRVVVADALAFVAICGYRHGYQRQLGADALLTFADKEKPAQGGLGLVVGAKASSSNTAKSLVISLETFWKLRFRLSCH